MSPERFSGYHTGVDFEIFPEEESSPVPVSAICTGPMLLKEVAQGYGGVVVQRCLLDGGSITVIYGHLKFSSVSAESGESLAAGSRIGVLGAGFSAETDGERKHLHLGVHRGSNIDLRGYVPTSAELNGWIDVSQYLSGE